MTDRLPAVAGIAEASEFVARVREGGGDGGRKAIGWALRQYARTNPAAVRQFLTINRVQLSRLSLREAAKHL